MLHPGFPYLIHRVPNSATHNIVFLPAALLRAVFNPPEPGAPSAFPQTQQQLQPQGSGPLGGGSGPGSHSGSGGGAVQGGSSGASMGGAAAAATAALSGSGSLAGSKAVGQAPQLGRTALLLLGATDMLSPLVAAASQVSLHGGFSDAPMNGQPCAGDSFPCTCHQLTSCACMPPCAQVAPLGPAASEALAAILAYVDSRRPELATLVPQVWGRIARMAQCSNHMMCTDVISS